MAVSDPYNWSGSELTTFHVNSAADHFLLTGSLTDVVGDFSKMRKLVILIPGLLCRLFLQ